MPHRTASALATLTFVATVSTAELHAATITGIVRDQDTNAVVEGAIVTLQATTDRATTAPDGSYTLDVTAGTGLKVVAAKKGYYNELLLSDAPASGVDFLIEAIPQDDDPTFVFADPATSCNFCHPDQFNQWNGSPMAKAGVNTWVDDIYSGLGTPGGMGGFVYLRDSVQAAANPESECAACHQPELWIETNFVALTDPTQPIPPTVAHGISCDVCHKIADIDVIAHANFPGIFPGAVTFTRPTSASGPVMYGALGDADFTLPGSMRPAYQPQLGAEVCAACHQDAADPDLNHTYNGVISEPTYLEWVVTPYADPKSPLYATCVDCHMPAFGATTACSIPGSPMRDSDTIRSHAILGTTPEFLENAVELDMQTQVVGSEVQVDVSITNSLTGHQVPTGVTVRNMILLVEAWREEDGVALAHTGSQVIHDLGGIGDPASGYYAGLAGKFYAKVNHDAVGNGPTFFTDATGIQFDSRIAALDSDDTNYTFELPLEGGTVHVRSRLIYRRAFRFLVDAKNWTEDGHGNPLEDVAAPHFGHLMESQEDVFLTGSIPTLSQWSVTVMALLLAICGTVVFGRARGSQWVD